MENVEIGTKASTITIVINSVLCVFKIIAALVGKSSAMLADATHSLADIMTTVVVIIGLKVSSKEPDEAHPYGHEKFEPVFAKVMSMILICTGISIGYKACTDLIKGNYNSPGIIALVAAAVSIVVKEGMYWYTIIIARRIKSITMETDAWHHRSDAISSIGTFAGIYGARMGIKVLDPIAGLLVSVLIIKVGVDYYFKAVKELVNHSADSEVNEKITAIARNVNGVQGVKNLKTRIFRNKIYADIEINVDGKLSIREAHDIAVEVHDSVERDISDIKHCLVKMEPEI